MGKRVRRGRKFWRALVTEFEDAGGRERHQAFADRHGVKCDSFRRWLYLFRAEKRGVAWQRVSGRRARKGPSDALPWPIVEVRGTPAMPGPAFELELGAGRVLRIPAAFETDALRRLLTIFDGGSAT